jgi:hypothetical protein
MFICVLVARVFLSRLCSFVVLPYRAIHMATPKVEIADDGQIVFYLLCSRTSHDQYNMQLTYNMQLFTRQWGLFLYINLVEMTFKLLVYPALACVIAHERVSKMFE